MSLDTKQPVAMLGAGTLLGSGGFGIAVIITMALGAEPVSTATLGNAITSILAMGVALVLWLTGRKRDKPPGGGAAGAIVALVLAGSLLVAPSNGCGTAFADGAATAGTCVARCALSCATSWVGDLVDLPEPDEQYGHTEGTLPRPGAVLQLLVRDDAGDPVAIMGRLVASPQLVDGGLRVGLMRTADGTLLSVLLAPEPRIWHASAELFDAPIAPDGWVPSDMPVGLQDMVDRLGEPPAVW
jgi:hypothetical protein